MNNGWQDEKDIASKSDSFELVFEKKLKLETSLINKRLGEYLQVRHPENLYNAMNYSVFAGGKRLRPVLLLCAYESVCGQSGVQELERYFAPALPFACALEMIHTYSLIHDDLPAIDNDDLRRGKKTNHIVYGEAMAILAGDGLLNMAYETMSSYCERYCEVRNIRAMSIIAGAAGAGGMVGGQTVDIEFENKQADIDTLTYIHRNKTGRLIQACLVAGAVLGGAKNEIVDIFCEIGDKLGIAFQIRDDILDVYGDTQKLGKNVRSDEKNKKATYVSLYGLDKAKEDYARLCGEILSLIRTLPGYTEYMNQLVLSLVDRES